MNRIVFQRKCSQFLFTVLTLLILITPHSAFAEGYTIEEYNSELPKSGLPFEERYPITFYTGFAPKIETPERVHFRVGRGNQLRLTAPLDEYSVLTYAYRLKKRYETYATAINAGMISAFSANTGFSMLERFNKIIESPVYGILETVAEYDSGETDSANLYAKSLALIEALNPGRVFRIDLDLAPGFAQWNASDAVAVLRAGGSSKAQVLDAIDRNPGSAIVAANDIVFGRVNVTQLSSAMKEALAEAVAAGTEGTAALNAAGAKLFSVATAGKYDFRTYQGGSWRAPLQCANPAASCRLVYPEFTAVYPNGSVRTAAKDRLGNSINMIRTQGAMNFVARAYHDVDHIRNESHYAWAPKLDFELIGNGVHNAAVSHDLSPMRHIHAQLDVDRSYDFAWFVSRGPVSSGCIRAAAGHVWEIREIFPSDADAMTQVVYSGNKSADFDVYDIDGDGKLEVIGVDYIISYSLKGPSGDSKRKGKTFNMDEITKDGFYASLYGSGQYVKTANGYEFTNPYVSYFNGNVGSVAPPFSAQLRGTFPLYEQAYEQDKVQTYSLNSAFRSSLGVRNNFASLGKQMVRVLARVSACGPFASQMPNCNEAAFDREFSNLLEKL